VAAVAVWTYPGFPVLIGFAGLYLIAHALQRGRFLWPALLWPLTGVLGAFIAHPAFPEQFYGYWLEFVVHSLAPGGLEAIAEWLPPSKGLLLLGLAAPAALFFALVLSARRHDPLGSALLVATVFFIFASALSLKPFEYVLPFLILYAARQSRTPLARLSPERGGRRALFEGSYVAVAAALLIWSVPQISNRMRLQYRIEDPSAHFAAADWLAANTPRNTLVALPWDQFPAFYYRNSANRYLNGLNPVYSYGADPGRYLLSRRLFSARGPTPGSADPAASAAPADVLKALGARFAVLDRRLHARTLVGLLEGAERSADAVYHNARFVVIKLR
jgi:hypothetical protein